MVSARPRDRILTTATELFEQEGIGAVGVNRIIGQADVAPMTLYRQFGNKDTLVAATIEQWSTSWLHRLADAMDRRGDDPADRFDGLWDELQAWFDEQPFRGSLVANAATELRSEPDHPAQVKIAQHRQALRQLLEDLAKASGADDPTILAAQLQVLVDGAITAASVDRTPASAAGARALARAAVTAARLAGQPAPLDPARAIWVSSRACRAAPPWRSIMAPAMAPSTRVSSCPPRASGSRAPAERARSPSSWRVA